MPPARDHESLKKELGLGDLVLAQILFVVGSTWVGIAAKLGRAHTAFWIAGIVLYYLPLAAVVIRLNRMMPLEGGLYQWAKAGFGEMGGFLTAWNLCSYAAITMGSILFVVPTDLAYMIGPSAAWIPHSPAATIAITGLLVAAIALVAVHGLDFSRWLHNTGSAMILMAYAILLPLPLWALWRGSISHFEAVPLALPAFDLFSLAIFGQMTVGALSGFEYIAILAGECRSAGRNIGRSVMISAPVICLMFVLGTSSVLAFIGGQPINLIGPIPQTFRLALGNTGFAGAVAPLAILLLIIRAVASASLVFTGLTRIPMTAGWDHLLPAWFAHLDPRRRTPVHSICFVALLVVAFIALSQVGVEEQEANQLLGGAANVHYAFVYVALFALPLTGALRSEMPRLLKLAAIAGLASSLIAAFIALYPVVNVVSRGAYALKIGGVVLASNALAAWVYRRGVARRALIAA